MRATPSGSAQRLALRNTYVDPEVQVRRRHVAARPFRPKTDLFCVHSDERLAAVYCIMMQ